LLLCCFFGVKIPTTKRKIKAAGKDAKGRIKDVDELHSHILTALNELDQHVIDTAVRQHCTHLCACDKAKDGQTEHFEHKLSQ